MFESMKFERLPDNPGVFTDGLVYRICIEGIDLEKTGMEAAKEEAVKKVGKTTKDIIWSDYVLLHRDEGSIPCVMVDVFISPEE